VVLGGVTIVDTDHSWRVLETSSPPVYYVDREDVAPGVLQPCEGASWCEWKGQASYFDLVVGATPAGRARPLASGTGRARHAAWGYDTPSPAFAAIAGHVAIYAGRVDACFLGGEAVRAQPGDFYGGWLTSRVTGPFKGDPGTLGW